MEERINEKEMICVICPNSCRMSVWKDTQGEIHVSGNQCIRGEKYGIKEYTNPERMLITTMRIEGGKLPVIPVRSREPLPKGELLEAVKIVNDHVCNAPVKMGDVLIENIVGTDIDVIASRDMDEYEEGARVCERYDENDPEEVVHYTLLDAFYNGKTMLSEDEKIHLENVERQIIERLKKFGLRIQ
jgi:CxxC motif-containing protein